MWLSAIGEALIYSSCFRQLPLRDQVENWLSFGTDDVNKTLDLLRYAVLSSTDTQ
jgi:hypothetical protein